MRCVTVLLLLVVGVVGCAPAAPSPTPTVPPPSTSATVEPRVTLPPRPREIRVDDLDPCELLTAVQREDLGLNTPPVPSNLPDPFYGPITSCSHRGNGSADFIVDVTLAPEAGIERYTTDAIAAELIPIEIEAFPAIVVRSTRIDDFCSVVIDIADGQLVDVQFGEGFSEEPIPQEQLCAGAQDAADLVMENLVGG